MKIKHVLALITCIMSFSNIPGFMQGATTSGFSGKASDDHGNPLTGATVAAFHKPAGNLFGTMTRSYGRYNHPNVQPGGPYSISVSFVGFIKSIHSGMILTPGDEFTLNISLSKESTSLDEVVITNLPQRILKHERNSTSFSIDAGQTWAAQIGIRLSFN